MHCYLEAAKSKNLVVSQWCSNLRVDYQDMNMLLHRQVHKAGARHILCLVNTQGGAAAHKYTND